MPKYQEAAACCHLGRELFTYESCKYFEWENSSLHQTLNGASFVSMRFEAHVQHRNGFGDDVSHLSFLHHLAKQPSTGA